MLDPNRPFFISPPFGAYLRHRCAYSVLGSYTVLPRPGRTRQVLRTVRPLGYTAEGEPNGWVNKVGLRNAGMDVFPRSAYPTKPHQIVSLSPLVPSDWHAIERWLDERFQRPIVELNVSCPNVDEHPELPPAALLQRITGGGATVIMKLPPVGPVTDLVAWCVDAGVTYLHLSNTLPSPVGGISGRALREVNLLRVEEAANWLERAGYKDFRHETGVPADDRGHPPSWGEGRYGNVALIAGGGIYTAEHLRAYRNAGATRFSLATAWFWPPRAMHIMRNSL